MLQFCDLFFRLIQQAMHSPCAILLALILSSFFFIVTTKCVLAELASHPVLRKANFIAKNFKIHNCFHSKVLPPVDCFDSFIGIIMPQTLLCY